MAVRQALLEALREVSVSHTRERFDDRQPQRQHLPKAHHRRRPQSLQLFLLHRQQSLYQEPVNLLRYCHLHHHRTLQLPPLHHLLHSHHHHRPRRLAKYHPSSSPLAQLPPPASSLSHLALSAMPTSSSPST